MSARRGTLLVVSAIAVLVSSAATAGAADYRPARCDSAVAYEGPPPHAARIPVPARDIPAAAPLDSATAAGLDRALAEAMRLARAPFATAAVRSRAGAWSATRDSGGGAAARTLWLASAGKLFTAIAVMQLVDEGRLALDEPIARWFPRFPNARAITVDHLLRHTAGVFSANEDLVVRRERRYRSPEENVAIAARHGAMFCPGRYWRYSNTGYDMLGRIVEAVEGRPYHEVVNERVTKRLGLATLRALAPREEPGDLAPLAPSNPGEPRMVPNWAYAAGCVVGSAADMVEAARALLEGRLVSGTLVERMFERPYPMFDAGTFYGRGVMLYELPGGGTWLGHSGGAPGAKAVVLYSPGHDAYVAVALTGDGSAEATANLLLRALREVPAGGD